MKTLVFFRRTCTVPGGSKFLRRLESKPDQEPVVLKVLSRVVYKVYRKDRAVVYTGIDMVKETKFAPQSIIRMIIARENIPDPLAWSFYDLGTSLGYEKIPDGAFEYNVVFLVEDTMPVEVEGGALLEYCPPQVLEDFHVFIYNTQFARHEKLTMKAFQRARYDPYFDLDDSDDEEDDDEVSSDDDTDGPTQTQ